MPLQNRVTPFGDIIADPARGTLMGNRGILHDGERRLGAVRWRHPHWIACRLAFKNRRQTVMQPGGYTQLFFLDEAVALAAGHRPCAECRRADYARFLECWSRAHGARPRAAELDRILHAARLDGGTRRQRRVPAALDALPDGCFIRLADEDMPRLVLGDRLLAYAPGGYGAARGRTRRATVELLTPEPIVATIRAGYAPELHPTAAG